MAGGDALRLRKTKPIAAMGAGGVGLIEALEDVRQGFRLDTNPGIGDPQAIGLQRDGNVASGWRVFDRVVEKNEGQAPKRGGISGHGRRLQLSGHVDLLRTGQR